MSTGRPKASSREVLAEAACELFLENGYAETSVADIARRAGVSRSSFFNYFESKADVLWAGLDARIDDLEVRLDGAVTPADVPALSRAVADLAVGFEPDALALAMVNARAMSVVDELERGGAERAARIGRVVAQTAQRAGWEPVEADVAGAAYGGAVVSAVWLWAHEGAGRASISHHLARALDVAGRTLGRAPGGRGRSQRDG